MKNFITLTHMRMLLTMRNRMFLFFSVIMPFGFFFLYSGIFAKGNPVVVKYLLGPVISIAVMGSFWGMSAALVIYREQGILRRFHIAPVSASDMLAASVVANYLLILPMIGIELLLARFVFHVNNLGNLYLLFAVVTIGIFSFACMGLVIASVTNTMQETQVLNQLIWLPLLFLSGATVPFSQLPKVVMKVALFLPATYLVSALKSAIYRPSSAWNVRDLLVALSSLCFWAILTFFLSAQLFRWEPESKIPRKAKLYVAATAIPFLILGLWELHYGHIEIDEQTIQRSLSSRSKPDSAPTEASGAQAPSEERQ